MTTDTGNPRSPAETTRRIDPLSWMAAAGDYMIDSWQRSVLYADVRRQRSSQYRRHLQETVPNVLDFEAELVMSGRDLPRPVNYVLVRILPEAPMRTDPRKRPFVVVDPRAGHGPGIGGFKADSEVGAILQAGHPCYFVGFTPDPVPGQSIEDVMRAEAAFLRRVAELHPQAQGKPAVIGNCQAGWQVLMTAAVWPELFGPIIVAGTPLSYWAGRNPMRYAGGLLGGSWLTALTSDLGHGRFDGAWLVQNFEQLDPANTLWTKQYQVYANVDTEGPRYLGFEKYWGGYVFLEGGEMQTIVDDLFIGNRLATAELVTSDGVRIDLRNIRSPIVVFCSHGDNITPPGQALGWITDLYRDDEDLMGHDQTIVFATHDSIGHLGIFVSGSVGRREHRGFANNIELIDSLPAGLFRAVVADEPEAEPTGTATRMTIRQSSVAEVRDIVDPDPAEERIFAAAARVSEINLALYRNLAQPWVRALSSPQSAAWMQALHPMRLRYQWWLDHRPLARGVEALAGQVRDQRRPVAPNNPFMLAQQAMSDAIIAALDGWRDARDGLYAQTFKAIYGSPVVRALAGQSASDPAPARPHPGDTPEHRRWLAEQQEKTRRGVTKGGLEEAAVRALAHVLGVRGLIDERLYRCAAELADGHIDAASTAALRQMVRAQMLVMRLDASAAVAAIPTLLATESTSRRQQALAVIVHILSQVEDMTATERQRLSEIQALFDAAPPAGSAPRTPRASASRPTRKAASKKARP